MAFSVEGSEFGVGLAESVRLTRTGGAPAGRGRLSKRANARLRRALYWPAIVAMRHNPILGSFGQRLLAAGRPNFVVIAAVMRKLLHLAFGVLKHGRPFDPNWTACRT